MLRIHILKVSHGVKLVPEAEIVPDSPVVIWRWTACPTKSITSPPSSFGVGLTPGDKEIRSQEESMKLTEKQEKPTYPVRCPSALASPGQNTNSSETPVLFSSTKSERVVMEGVQTSSASFFWEPTGWRWKSQKEVVGDSPLSVFE